MPGNMNPVFRNITVLILLALFLPDLSFAQRREFSGDLIQAINKAVSKRCVDPWKTGISVVALPSGKQVYKRNGSLPLMPASVQKLITTAAALHYLGPDYRFKTEILHTGSRKGGIINGDLVIRGKGDPDLTPEKIWLIAEQIKRMGVNEVTGALLVDGSYFDLRKTAPSWSNNHTQQAYDARLGALSVSFNTVAVHIYPGGKNGGPAIVGLFPDSPYLKLVNKAKTVSTGRRGVLARRSVKNGKIVITVTGVMRPGSKGKVIYLNVHDPLKYAGVTFKEFFQRGGIAIKGGVRIAAGADNATLIYTHKSDPLALIVRKLNKFSNNFVAEQIAKTIASEKMGAPGTHVNALKLFNRFMTDSGIDISGMALADASGLSRQNRLSANVLTKLLTVMNGRFDIGPDFLAALGIMGVDGSVRKRMSQSPAKSQARAKTGSLSGLSSLAGYVSAKNGGLFAFAILLNNNKCYYKDADKIEDEIVTSIYKYGEKE